MSPTDIIMRRAGAADLPALADLVARTYRTAGTFYYRPDTLEAAIHVVRRATPALVASGRFHVAEDGYGRLVGCAGWAPGEAAGLGELRHVAVSPAAAGRRVGEGLVLRCEREASDGVVDRFECVATLMAEGFYTRLGYRLVRFRELNLGGRPFAVAQMQKIPAP